MGFPELLREAANASGIRRFSTLPKDSRPKQRSDKLQRSSSGLATCASATLADSLAWVAHGRWLSAKPSPMRHPGNLGNLRSRGPFTRMDTKAKPPTHIRLPQRSEQV